jgi:hypothetical protein
LAADLAGFQDLLPKFSPGRLRTPKTPARSSGGPVLTCAFSGVSDGIRTRDTRDHNPVLYQLSYTHHDHTGEKAGDLK